MVMILNDKSKPHNLKVVGSNPTPATKNNILNQYLIKPPTFLTGGIGFFTLTFVYSKLMMLGYDQAN
jgi:hypothetical protein